MTELSEAGRFEPPLLEAIASLVKLVRLEYPADVSLPDIARVWGGESNKDVLAVLEEVDAASVD